MKYSKEEKTKRLEEWKQSGKSAWAFARENGFKQQTFAKWVKAEKESKGRFIEIRQGPRAATAEKPEILIESGDMKIHIPIGLSKSELSSVFESLRAVI